MSLYNCIDAYKPVKDPEQWDTCPNCSLKPRVWLFNNGESTACGCGKNRYDHFSIHSESILSIHSRTGNTAEFDPDTLKNNWNEWCRTGKINFEHAGKREDGRW